MTHLVHKLSDDLKGKICYLSSVRQYDKTYPYDSMQAISLIEKAMFIAEIDKAYPDRNKHECILDQPPSKTLRELLVLKKNTEKFHLNTDAIDELICYAKKHIAPTPGRQKNASVKARKDGGVSRLAKATLNALTGSGIPCTGTAEGYKIIEFVVRVVYGDEGVKRLTETDILRTR